MRILEDVARTGEGVTFLKHGEPITLVQLVATRPDAYPHSPNASVRSK